MKKVFVLISDENYLEHAKSLFYAAKTIGKWDGDLCLISNNVREEKLTEFKKFGVDIFNINEKNYYYANFFIFDTYFKKWDYLISMDCDFTIFGDLNKIVSEEEINQEVLNVDKEPFTIKSYFCWDYENGEIKNEKCEGREKYFEELNKMCDIENFGFNAGFMSFNTKLIKTNTLLDLKELSEKYQPVNFHTSQFGSDQPILNVYFQDKVNFIKNEKISYWKSSNENTIAQHHCRWDAPWINNFFSKRLSKTYFQNYRINLDKFNEINLR
jgi:hypothetical protein